MHIHTLEVAWMCAGAHECMCEPARERGEGEESREAVKCQILVRSFPALPLSNVMSEAVKVISRRLGFLRSYEVFSYSSARFSCGCVYCAFVCFL